MPSSSAAGSISPVEAAMREMAEHGVVVAGQVVWS